jgi:hypothetical protein
MNSSLDVAVGEPRQGADLLKGKLFALIPKIHWKASLFKEKLGYLFLKSLNQRSKRKEAEKKNGSSGATTDCEGG